MGQWLQSHKKLFLASAVFMLSLSLFSAVHEKKKQDANTGLIIFAIVAALTLALLSYNKIRFGYFM